jgi:hypothetical protein
MDALTATCAGCSIAPLFIHLADNAGMDATGGEFPDMRSFEFGADSNATRADDAPVVVEHKPRMGHIDRELGEVIGKSDRIDTEGARHILQFTMTVRDTDSADVISLD